MSESRRHYIFYYARFTEHPKILHEQINQIGDSFKWNDMNIFDILGGSNFDIGTKMII